jgi:hypothetical protein
MYGISLPLLLLMIAGAITVGYACTRATRSVLLGVVVGIVTLIVLVFAPFIFLKRSGRVG